jgi:hypothetical protein
MMMMRRRRRNQRRSYYRCQCPMSSRYCYHYLSYYYHFSISSSVPVLTTVVASVELAA